MKRDSGKLNLTKKILAVIGTLFTSFENNVHATDPSTAHNNGNDLNFKKYQKNILNPKLVLKLSSVNANVGKMMMHTSHSSHSSHSSHASHRSHYSSTSPSYQPNELPVYKPTLPVYKSDTTSDNKTKVKPTVKGSKTLPVYTLGSRILFKGCRGTDVEELQELLIGLGYDVIANGIFDETTKVAVIDFQKSNNLTSDGRVGAKTLLAIKSK